MHICSFTPCVCLPLTTVMPAVWVSGISFEQMFVHVNICVFFPKKYTVWLANMSWSGVLQRCLSVFCVFLGSAVNNLCTCKSLCVPEVVCPRAPLPGDVFSGCAWAQDLSGVCCQGYLFYLCAHPAIKSLSGSKTPQKTSLKVSILRPCPCFVVWPFFHFLYFVFFFFSYFLN